MGYTKTMRLPLLVVLALAASLAACGGNRDTLPTGPSPVSARLELRYELAPGAATSEAVDCAAEIRVYPSWWGYAQVTMVPVGPGRFALLFEEVPIGAQRVNVVAPEGCAGGSLAANGVPLDGTGDDLAFRLHSDGRVTR